MPEGREFYGDLLGFTASDTLDFSRAPWFPKDADLGDPRGYFMRYGTDHHAFVLFPKRVMDHRADRKFAPEVTINQITWQCGSLKEVVDAHTYFEEQQVRIQRVGRDMPGSNWHVYVYDPDGHTNEFYYGIEQVGWNRLSKPRDMYYRGFNVSQHSFWTATRQKDGTFVSQIRAALMAKNRTNKTLHLLTARVVRPNMPGEVLQVFINTAADSSWHGVNALPPNDTILVSVNIMIRGFPGRVRENPPDLAVVLAVADDEGNEQRVKLPLKAAPIPLSNARGPHSDLPT